MDCGTIPVAVIKKKGKIASKWIKLQNTAANDDGERHLDWTEDLEAEFQKIKNEQLTLKDTAIGRENNKGINNAFAMNLTALPTKKQALLDSLSGVGNNNFQPGNARFFLCTICTRIYSAAQDT